MFTVLDANTGESLTHEKLKVREREAYDRAMALPRDERPQKNGSLYTKIVCPECKGAVHSVDLKSLLDFKDAGGLTTEAQSSSVKGVAKKATRRRPRSIYAKYEVRSPFAHNPHAAAPDCKLNFSEDKRFALIHRLNVFDTSERAANEAVIMDPKMQRVLKQIYLELVRGLKGVAPDPVVALEEYEYHQNRLLLMRGLKDHPYLVPALALLLTVPYERQLPYGRCDVAYTGIGGIQSLPVTGADGKKDEIKVFTALRARHMTGEQTVVKVIPALQVSRQSMKEKYKAYRRRNPQDHVPHRRDGPKVAEVSVAVAGGPV